MLIVLALCLLTSNAYSQNWGKYLNKIDEYYLEGRYEKADAEIEKFEKKLNKKYHSKSNLHVLLGIKKSKIDLINYRLWPFLRSINETDSLNKVVNRKNDHDFIVNSLDISELYIKYGNFNLADQALTDAEQRYVGYEEQLEYLKVKMELARSAILLGQGFYNKSLTYIDGNIEFFKTKLTDKEVYLDSKGRLKSRPLEEAEVYRRFSDFAQLLSLKSQVYWKKGDHIKADSAFDYTLFWIGEQDILGDKSTAYLETEYYFTLMSKEFGMESDLVRKSLGRIHKNVKGALPAYSELALTVHYNLLMEMAKYNYVGFENSYENYLLLTGDHYHATSSYRVNAVILKTYSENNFASPEENVAMLSGYINNIPSHKIKEELLDFSYNESIAQKKYSDIGNYAKQIVEVSRDLYGESSPKYHMSLIRYANYLLDFANDIEKVDSIYHQSWLEIVKPEIDIAHKDYLNNVNHLAKYYESVDNFVEASKVLEESKVTSRTVYDNQDYEYGVALNQVAALQIKIGDYLSAQQNIFTANKILSPFKSDRLLSVHYVQNLEINAKLLAVYGMYDQAETLLNEAQRTLKRVLDLQGYDDLNSKLDIVEINVKLGKYGRTQEDLDETIATYMSLYGSNSSNLIRPLVSNGYFKLATGEYSEADKSARNALKISIETLGEESSKTGLSYELISDYHKAIGDYEEAEKEIEKALDIYRKKFGSDHINYAKALSKSGIIKVNRGKEYEEIKPMFDSALYIVKNSLSENSPAYAEILSSYAILNIKFSKYDSAFQNIDQAYSIWQKKVGTRNNINKANIYTLAGDIYYSIRDYAEAESYYASSRKIFEDLFNDSHPDYLKLQFKLGKVYYMSRDMRRARRTMDFVINQYNTFIDKYFPSLSEREKAKFWNTINPAYEFYYTIAIKQLSQRPKLKSTMLNNALKTKSLLLSSSVKLRQTILNSNDQLLIREYKEWQMKKDQLTAALSMSKEQLSELGMNVQSLENEVLVLEKSLGQRSTLFSNNNAEFTTTWKEIKGVLKSNEVAVEMVRFRHFNHTFQDSVVYAAFYFKNERTYAEPGMLLLRNGKELEDKYFRYYRNCITFKVKDRFSYEKYWEPIISKVGSTSTIYLSADGVYNQINLEAIPTKNNQYVIDNSNIILLSNTKEIYKKRSSETEELASNYATMVGDPEFYVSARDDIPITVGKLPGTKKEIEQLTDVLSTNGWETDFYLETDATEEMVKSIENPKIFHIATHGFFAKEEDLNLDDEVVQTEDRITRNPLQRTGLMLTGAGDLLFKTNYNFNMDNGILTAYEAMNMNLDKTELVVLSACETGLGDISSGEGVYGLQRAFIVAGANTLIMSLFKVDDVATQMLMVSFYNKWLETGNKRQAFIDAKKEIRNQFKDPIYWGAFVMIGFG